MKRTAAWTQHHHPPLRGDPVRPSLSRPQAADQFRNASALRCERIRRAVRRPCRKRALWPRRRALCAFGAGGSQKGVRNRALLLLVAGVFRRSELVALDVPISRKPRTGAKFSSSLRSPVGNEKTLERDHGFARRSCAEDRPGRRQELAIPGRDAAVPAVTHVARISYRTYLRAIQGLFRK
jgi:hypothetical protein